jgi:hypothetical protein
MADPDDAIEAIDDHDDLDLEQIAEDAGELFTAPDHSPPAGDADAPPPPG